MSKIKRLFFDIETSPNVGLFWSAGWKQTIGTENIIKERSIICICYKWQGEKKVYSLQWNDQQNDKELLQSFTDIASDADELIGHNGDKYDLAFIRTRCLLHRITMFPDYSTVDTLKVARSKFRFNSNRLDYIGNYLGVGRKIKTSYSLWKKVLLDNDSKALAEMIKYCKQDVRLLEDVHGIMSPHIKAKFHAGVKQGKHKTTCPDCGSGNIKIVQTRISASGTKKKQLQCNDCGKYHTVAASALKTHK